MIRNLNADLTELLDIPELIVEDYEIQMGIVFIHAYPKDDNQICEKCGSRKVKIEETLPKRVVRDRDIFGKQCYIIIHPRRFKCADCDTRFTERFSFLDEKKSYTKRYAEWIHKLCLKTDISYVSQIEDIGYKKVESIFYSISKEKLSLEKELKFNRIGIDEIALKKGHKDFITVISDITNGRPIAVLKDRSKESLEEFFDGLDKKTKDRIKEVSIDMWGPYYDVIKEHLPKAKVVVDRFHVQSNLNEALTSVRRRIQKDLTNEEKEVIKGSRWILVKNMEDLDEEEKSKLDEIYRKCKTLKRYHQAKEEFRKIFDRISNRDYARKKINEWIEKIHKENLYLYSKFIETLERWKSEILNYFISKTTNGFVEGLNNKIKLLKRIGFGFTNFEHFALRIMQI
jgi:transposase